MNDEDFEEIIKEKGPVAPRITIHDINNVIAHDDFYVFPDSQLTVCCITLNNGFTVTGESACVSPENFDAKLGRNIARDNAVSKIWLLEGYLLKQKLYEDK